MKKTSDWKFSHEIPSDVTVHTGDASFLLHKFPLVSKCGYIRKILSNPTHSDPLVIEIPDVPGGPEGFELAAKFCYGINFELSTENISIVRCVSEFLEMTEDYATGNLVTRSEAYLDEIALKTLAGAVTVLQSSTNLLPMAEKVKLITRCIDTIAYIVTRESEFFSSGSTGDFCFFFIESERGFKQHELGPILMLYAQKCLQGLEIHGKNKKKIDSKQEHEKRIVLETIVSFLPRERNTMSVSFLSMLLRAAIYLETTMACKLDLEKRMGLQLGQAVLDDILIPSFHFDGDTMFDVDTVQRVMMNYLEYELEAKNNQENDMEKVGKLMESYLAEIASDRNLLLSKFVDFAEHIPEQAKVSDDGMYRAIDIYLKVHPTLSDMERKKVCSLMDCEKLSREACAHAAQNDRLPVQTVCQVIFYEQQRLRDTMGGDGLLAVEPTTTTTASTSTTIPAATATNKPLSHELSWLKKENQDLKFELLKMKMTLKEVERLSSEKYVVRSPSVPTRYSADHKPLFPRKSFLNSVSKKLGKLMPLLRVDGIVPLSTRGRNKPSKDRRHSMS
ncbi:unnamed protein product [Lactuca virosa]|uniref:NPH3 domain-containing protein n=1 Tax=Lactuca virosa TaxID=75947 RepID=A0AAU9LZZ5_9ASTR|nr:unnamed protein product [Lactuca virosa]